jgi:simple sugar transport system substrate-binding protein
MAAFCLLVGCGKAEQPAPPTESASSGAKEATLKLGFIYVGPRDDFGYNQAHSEGAKAIAKLPGITVLEEEKVPETNDVQKTMESMLKLEGVSVVFPTSSG